MASTNSCARPGCGHTSAEGLQRCSRCRKVAYCSPECQAAAWASHKASCVRPNYVVDFHLAPGSITNPAVRRTLSCPAHTTFYALHLALQTAFGWATTHSFDFAVMDPDYQEPDDMMQIVQRRMALGPGRDRLPASMSREYMFRVVDPVEHTMFSGIDRMHESSRRHVNTPERKADAYKLFQLFDDQSYAGCQMVYTYDFGDNWEHHFTITGRAEATDDFVCLDGCGHPVAEDSRGTNGWEDLKAAYRAAQPTAEQAERRKWFEKTASNADPRGLAGDRVHAWDRDQVNRDLVTETMLARFQRKAGS